MMPAFLHCSVCACECSPSPSRAKKGFHKAKSRIHALLVPSQTNLRARVGSRTRTARRELPTTKFLFALTAADTHALAFAQNPAVLMLAKVTLQKLFSAAADQPCTLHIVTFVRKQMTLVNQADSGSCRALPLIMCFCIASRTAYATWPFSACRRSSLSQHLPTAILII